MSRKQATSTPLSAAIASGLRSYRVRQGLTQEDVAGAARMAGLPSWTAVTIAHIEAGRRKATSLDDLICLSLALHTTPDRLIDMSTARIQCNNFDVPTPWLRFLVTGGKQGTEPPLATVQRGNTRILLDEGATEAERKAAQRLHVTVDDIRAAAKALKRGKRWSRRTLDREREYRLEQLASERQEDARTLQARRGHITRKLLDDLTEQIDKGI
jgi:transcriptional regulator with XRE-family HTH domain